MAMITIGGTAVASPKSMEVGIQDIDGKSERNAAGTLIRDRIAVKRKLSLEWPALTTTQISTILQAVSPVFFSVTYLDPQSGNNDTRTFYVGDRSAPVAIVKGSTYWWEGLKFDLIEQ